MRSAKSECETLNADFRISAEIDKESELALGKPQIVEKLRTMLVGKLANGF